MKSRLLITLVLLYLLASSHASRTPTSNPPPPPSSCIPLCPKYAALPAVQDKLISSVSGGHVLYLFGGQLTSGITQFVFDSHGGFLEVLGDSALLVGTLVPIGGPTTSGFFLTLSLHIVSSAAGFIEIVPASLVDTSAWTFWSVNTGSKLVGFGNFFGTEIEILQQIASKPFQIGLGASGENLELGAALWINLKKNCTIVAGDININLNCSTICPSGNTLQATAAEADPVYASDVGGFAFTFFNAPSTLGIQNWIFAPPGGNLDFNGNSLHLTGTLIPFSGVHAPLTVDITFEKTSPPASPHKELLANAYVPSGPVDPLTWQFYSFGSAPNTVSFGGNTFTITQQPGATPFQIGKGANGKNIKFGGSAWFDWTSGGHSGTGDINLDLNCPNGTNSVPPPPPQSGCSVSILSTPVSHWTEEGQDFTEWEIILTNTGVLTIVEVQFTLTFPASDNCAAKPGGFCLKEIWGAVAITNGFVYGLPSYVTGITPGHTFEFGDIVYGSVSYSVTATCTGESTPGGTTTTDGEVLIP